MKNTDLGKLMGSWQKESQEFVANSKPPSDMERWLLTASAKGKLKQANELLEAGADINCTDEERKTPLAISAECGHTRLFAFLLKRGADPEIRDINKRTAIHQAVLCGKTNLVKLLIAAKCKINAQDFLKRTPLFWAAENGHMEMVTILVDAGCDFNAKDSYGFMPLHRAIFGKHLPVMKILLDRGADVNGGSGMKSIPTPLMLAARQGLTEGVKLILSYKPNLTIRDPAGHTSLDIAVSERHEEITALLKVAMDV